MSERASTTVYIHFFRRQIEVFHGRHCDYCKCLVYFKKIYIIYLPANGFKHIVYCTNRCSGNPFRSLSKTAVTKKPRKWFQAAFFSS